LLKGTIESEKTNLQSYIFFMYSIDIKIDLDKNHLLKKRYESFFFLNNKKRYES